LSARAIGEDLRAAAARDPERAAVVTGGRSVSYGELDERADRLAAGLREAGVARGERVLLALPNGLPMCVAVCGVARSGAAFAPVNPTIKRDKLAEILDYAEPVVVLCDDEHREVVGAAVGVAENSPRVGSVDALSAEGPLPPAPLDVDLAAIMFTSGSTGEPKGVTLAHRNISFVTDSIVQYLEFTPEERVLSLLQLSFGYGLSQLFCCVRSGATLVLEPGIGFPGRLIRLLEDERITGLPAVPTVFQVLIALKGLAERELPHLRWLSNAGAGLPEPALQAVRRTFPRATLYSMYGQTECTRVCYLPPDQLDIRPNSVGVAIPGTEVWIEGEDGEALGPGHVGELIVRGSHVMQEYWRNPEGTQRSLRPGRWPWERVLATGDLFRTDEEGYLYFVGRRDDIIKSRGEKVAPREVEDALHGHPAVREAAVIGVPDRLLGEAVHAHVVLEAAGAVDGELLRGHCAELLEDHKIPQRVVLHDQLPRTPNGKIDKRALGTLGA
jgi:long-chain acyl-CoA synthetase